MPLGLTRHHKTGDLHFITFSCYERRPYLGTEMVRDLFEDALERMRQRYLFSITGNVVMPEHVHLLLSEPPNAALSLAVQAVKVSVVRRRKETPFWQPRYYDFNVFTERKRLEKLNYMHQNPVARGLVERPEDWKWSSFHHYSGQDGRVRID